MYPKVNLFIDGAWRPASSGKALPVLNPATGEEIGIVAHAEKADLDLALAAAQKRVRDVAQGLRPRALAPDAQAADVLRSRADEIATQMTMEQGKPVAESRGETLASADEGPAGEPLIGMEHQPRSTKSNSA